MNLEAIRKLGPLNTGAAKKELLELEKRLNQSLPLDYKELLTVTNGFYLKNGLKIYSTEEAEERNETFEVRKYAPGHLVIGDDSGGTAILIRLGNDSSPVFSVDQGVLDTDYATEIAESLSQWIGNGCQLD